MQQCTTSKHTSSEYSNRHPSACAQYNAKRHKRQCPTSRRRRCNRPRWRSGPSSPDSARAGPRNDPLAEWGRQRERGNDTRRSEHDASLSLWCCCSSRVEDLSGAGAAVGGLRDHHQRQGRLQTHACGSLLPGAGARRWSRRRLGKMRRRLLPAAAAAADAPLPAAGVDGRLAAGR